VLARLVEYTGPVDVPELDVTVAADEVVEFLLVDQYVLAEEKELRVEALETLGVGAIEQLLSTSLPGPPRIARDLGPLVEERRLLFWSADPEERALLSRVGLLGDLPVLDAADGGFGVAVNNAGANKIDSFLERTVDVTEQLGPDGRRRLVAEVELTNTAPSTGLPDYILGNAVGLPRGSSRLIVHFYGPAELDEVTRDGAAIDVGPFSEAGWAAYSTVVSLPPGGSVTYRLVFALPPSDPTTDGAFTPTRWQQPLRR
jgi:hypothetical protein